MPYFLNQNNREIFYEIHNEESNLPILVLIHGYGTSHAIFSKQTSILSKHFKLILFDAEGHGNSDKHPFELQEQMVKSTVTVLYDLMSHLSLGEQLGLLGYSLFGTAVAQSFSLKYKNRVQFLILLNGGNLNMDSTIKYIFWNFLPKYSRINLKEILNQSFDEIIERTAPLIIEIIQPEEFILSTDERQILIDRIKDEIWDLYENQINSSEIESLTLIIGAELDEEAPVVLSKHLRRTIADSEFHMVSMTGHLGLSQRSDEFNKIICTFLEKKGFINSG